MPKLTTDDITLHYQCLGEGEEDLILIHGLGANLAFWYMRIASVLAQHYRVIIYDLRGHGESSMPIAGYTLSHMTQDLQALMEHLQVKGAHVVGHSFGGTVALHYALSYPNKVATLTLADTQFSCLQPKVRLGDWPYWGIWKQRFIKQGITPPTDDEFIGMRLLSLLNQLSAKASYTDKSQTTRKPFLRQFNMGNKGTERWEKLLNATLAEKELDESEQINLEQIQNLTLPTLAIYGEYSYCLPCCEKLKDIIPHCQTVIVPEVGHFHPAVKPDFFVENLQQFLKAYSLDFLHK
ncbi:alpha/beta hydrolase [Nostoc sp. UHCC 0702]|nr:alpha/beta hydrolase [Nostoc sp. UHCC 0702]